MGSAGEVKLRVIQVGVNGWGATWVPRIVSSPRWELVAIADLDPEALAEQGEMHGIPAERRFAGLAEAAAAVEADAALIVTPVASHLAVATEAFEAGLDVLIEKPLADTMANSLELVSRAEAADRTLMVSQNYRFRRAAQVVARIMKEGWLGPLGFANITYRKELHFVTPDEPHGFAAYEYIRDMAIHHLDQIRGLLRCEPAVVYGHSYNPSWSWFRHPPMLNAVLQLEGGGVVEYFGSWGARGRQTTFDGDWYIECEEGQIEFVNNRVLVRPELPWLAVQMDGFIERNGWLEAEIPMDTPEDRSYVLEAFHRSLVSGRAPETNGRDNLRSIALTFALADSARLDEPRAIADYLTPANS
ncbi:MAG: Gfo/Idh/MocA family oxidoreductase [Actinobacteria bacterium]|nr:Gfo/Idh/MocA family oxidoreductase [Actinomycetota bacterium]